MRITITQTTSITLHRVSAKEVESKYKSGYFKTLKLPTVKGRVNILGSGSVPESKEDDQDSKIFTHHGKSGVSNTFVTTNHSQFHSFNTNGNLKKGGKCMNCMVKYEDRCLVGMPISIDSKYTKDGNVPVFICVKSFCDFSCMLRYAMVTSRTVFGTGTDSSTLISNIRAFHFLCNPNSKRLRPSNDPELIDENGGPMTLSQWKNSDYSFKVTGNLIYLPAKEVYQKI